MDWIIACGALSLGLLIGALVGWYVNEAKQINHKVLSLAVWVLAGGIVLGLFRFLSAGDVAAREIWLYPVGLLIGFVAVTILELQYYDYYGKKRPQKADSASGPKSH